jgi:hypothetical protein
VHVDDVEDRSLGPERRLTERVRGLQLRLVAHVYKPLKPCLIARSESAQLFIHARRITPRQA